MPARVLLLAQSGSDSGTRTRAHGPVSLRAGVALEGAVSAELARRAATDRDHEIAQTLAATVPNAELFVYPGEAHDFAEHDQRAAALLHRRALDFLQALVGDEFRAARRSHTLETTGRCVVRRRGRDEGAAS